MEFSDLAQSLQQLDGALAQRAASAVNIALNARNWLVGAAIVEFEQNGEDRAAYGTNLLPALAKEIAVRGLSLAGLERCRNFYNTYPGISATVSREFGNLLTDNKLQISATVSHLFEKADERLSTVSKDGLITPPEMLLTRLSFSQFIELLKLDDPLKRTFYEIEAIKGNWSVRELKRQVGSLLYERTGLSTDKEKLIRLVEEKAEVLRPGDIIRDPYIFEFIGLRSKEVVEESDLEQALLDDLQSFLLELGRGFCFEERQKRIQIGSEYYFIDLVFYHRILRCHVLIDLKTEPFNHAHAGQINTYVNYYKDKEMGDGDQAPIGLLLCTDKDDALAQYALGGMDENLFVSRYQTALPEPAEIQSFLAAEARKLGISSSRSPEDSEA